MFPERKGYLGVYAHYELLETRAVFDHAIHQENVPALSQTLQSLTTKITLNAASTLGLGVFQGRLMNSATDKSSAG